MRIIMAVSRDGYVARCRRDDMSWLGATDKAVFRILTGVGGEVAVGRTTADCMPKYLPGRNVRVLSRDGYEPFSSWGTLDEFYKQVPDGWLIGGQTVAMAALVQGYVDEVHLCRSDRMAFPCPGDFPTEDMLTPWLEANRHEHDYLRNRWWELEMTTEVLDVTVECWRRRSK